MDPEEQTEETNKENETSENNTNNTEPEKSENNDNGNDRFIMDSIGELAAQVKALRLAVDSFADMGGIIRETTDIDNTSDIEVHGTPSDFENDDDVVIDDDVIRDIDNVVFND